MKPELIPSKYNYSTIKKSNDDTKWIVFDKQGNSNKSGIKEWIKLSSLNNIKKYKIHDNGTNPFYVIVCPEQIFIYKATELFEPDKKKRNLMFEKKIKFEPWLPCMYIQKYKTIFVGKNEKKYTINKNYGSFTGNTLLIEIKPLEYLYIGSNIVKFKPVEKIESYHSVMGNSDVPYPFAFTKNYVYLMLNMVYTNRIKNDQDPYGSYYGNQNFYNTKFIKNKNEIVVKQIN
jgi:hypothetical protein